MAVAAILCVDGELDVHDSSRTAVEAAVTRRAEAARSRIGICVGDLEVGDPLGLARRLCDLATPGAILVSDPVRRAVGDRDFVDLGAVSLAGYRDRVHVFELLGATTRDRTVLAIDLIPHRRVVLTGQQEDDDARLAAELSAYDRTVWSIALAHRGLVDRARVAEYLIAFEDPLDALRTAIALEAAFAATHERLGTLELGLERGTLSYRADHWWGPAWTCAERARSSRFRHLGVTQTLIAAVGPPALQELGLVVEDVEELRLKGVPHRLSVAHVRLP